MCCAEPRACLCVQHQVAIVAVLDLEEVAHKAVGSHALSKVALRLHTLWCPLET